MSQAPAMPMYWDAYLADTTHLTTEEHGAYMLLLAAMWRRNGWVPDDDKDNARMLGLTVAKWRKIKARFLDTISGFRIENGKITQQKLQKTWENTQEKIEKNRMNGTKGGRPKSNENKDLAKADGFVSVNPNQSIPEPEPEPDIRGSGDDAGAREQPHPPPDQERSEREIVLEAIGVDPVSGIVGPSGKMIGRMADMLEFRRWRDDLGLGLEEVVGVIRDVMERKSDGPPVTFTYFSQAMQRYAGVKNNPKLIPINGANHAQRDTPLRQSAADDAAARRIAFAARAGRAPSEDCF